MQLNQNRIFSTVTAGTGKFKAVNLDLQLLVLTYYEFMQCLVLVYLGSPGMLYTAAVLQAQRSL